MMAPTGSARRQDICQRVLLVIRSGLVADTRM